MDAMTMTRKTKIRIFLASAERFKVLSRPMILEGVQE